MRSLKIINQFDSYKNLNKQLEKYTKNKWKNLHQYVVTKKISDISDAQYSDMFL